MRPNKHEQFVVFVWTLALKDLPVVLTYLRRLCAPLSLGIVTDDFGATDWSNVEDNVCALLKSLKLPLVTLSTFRISQAISAEMNNRECYHLNPIG